MRSAIPSATIPWASSWRRTLRLGNLWQSWLKRFQIRSQRLGKISVWGEEYTPEISRIDTKNGHFGKGSYLFQTIILGIHAWWFQIFLEFSPRKLGQISNLTICSNGLKPPTSFSLRGRVRDIYLGLTPPHPRTVPTQDYYIFSGGSP